MRKRVQRERIDYKPKKLEKVKEGRMSIKVGIITLHKNTNYGANLQAFASSAFVKNLGFDCILIDYFNDEQRKKSKVFSWLKLSWDKEKNKSFSRKIKLGLALALSAP